MPSPFQFGVREQTHQRAGNCDMYTLGDATRVFAVVFPDSSYDDSAALFHPDIPRLRTAHPSRVGLYLTNKSARQADDKNGCIWEVVCTYGPGSGALAPWQEPMIRSWSSQSTEHIVERDIKTEKPIRNSAACPFDPGVTVPRAEGVLTCSRNELYFDFGRAIKYVDSVNSDVFYGAQPGFCRCVGVTAQEQVYQDEAGLRTMYSSVQYQFAFKNPDFTSWQARILDAGFMKKSDSGALLPITLAGREPSAPVPLDGEGQPLANPETDEPVWLTFTIYPEKPFLSLGV